MRVFVTTIVAAIATTGCLTTTVENPHYDKALQMNQHAVLQTLNGTMKKHPYNPLNPFNPGNWSTHLDGVKKADATSWEPFGDRAGMHWLRVTPGDYVLRVKCTGKGFYVWKELPMEGLKAGHDYEIECHGASAAFLKILVTVKPTAPAPSAAAASSAQATSPKPSAQ